jgi:hypothetical protein
MSLFVNFICVYLLCHEIFRLWIYLLLILINKLNKYNQIKISFYIVEYLNLHLLILLISILIIVLTNFFPFIYIAHIIENKFST